MAAFLALACIVLFENVGYGKSLLLYTICRVWQVSLLDGEEGRRKAMPPPKNVFALERTYLTWTHMAVTVLPSFG